MGAALSAVGQAVYDALQDATLQGLTTGGWWDDVPQGAAFPFGWYELLTSTQARGMGTGNLPQIDLRLHVYSEYAGLAQGQAVIDRAIDVFEDQPLTVSGFTFCGRVFYDETIVLRDELINGVKCHELVSMFRLYVEE